MHNFIDPIKEKTVFSPEYLQDQQRALNRNLAAFGAYFSPGQIMPSSLMPKWVSEKVYLELKEKSEQVLSAIETLLRLYIDESSFRDLFPELTSYNWLLTKKPVYRNWIHLARFDLTQELNGSYKLMETNCDCPGGSVLMPLLKKAYIPLNIAQSFLENKIIVPQEIDSEYYFIDSLVSVYREEFTHMPEPRIAFLDSRFHRLHTEMELFPALAKKWGYSAERVSVQDLSNEKKFGLFYNKFDAFIDENNRIRPCIYETDPSEVSSFFQALEDSEVLNFNSFLSAYVAENKRIMALLHDPALASHFTLAQKHSIESLIPPTFTLNKNDSKFSFLMKEVICKKSEYVVKRVIDTRGRGVFIGKTLSDQKWQDYVQQAVDAPYIIQKYIEHAASYVYTADVIPVSQPMYSNIALYMIKGKASGLMCRASASHVCNVAASGCVQPCFIVKDND